MALIKCPECKNEISDNALICPYCGIAIRGNFITCPECSRLVSINAKACPECGFPIKKELIRKSQNAEKANKLYANAQTFLKNQQEKEALSYIEKALQINPDESTFIALKQHIEEIIEKKIQSAEIFKDVQFGFENGLLCHVDWIHGQNKGDLELYFSLVEKALHLYEDKEYIILKARLLAKKADILKAEENYQTAKQAFEKDNLLKAYQTNKISCSLFADNTLYLEFQKEIETRLCEQLYSQAKNSLEQKKYKDADDKITECLTYRPKVDVYIDLKKRIQSKMKRNKVLKRVFIGVIVTVLLVIGISIIGPRIVQTYNDNNAWNTAQNENTSNSYSSYIAHYPKGIHIEQAKGERDYLIRESENISISNPTQPIEQKVENPNVIIQNGKDTLAHKALIKDDSKLFPKQLNGKWGFVDKQGHEVIPFKYDGTGGFWDGLADVELNGKYGFIDNQGHTVIPFKYDLGDDFHDGLAWVVLNHKCGFIDKHGQEVIPFKYDCSCNFQDGLAAVELNGKWGCIDKQGHEVIPFKYFQIIVFHDGLSEERLNFNGKWGFIDTQGHEVIPFKYENASDFQDGLAAVALNGKYGFIDNQGHTVIPFKYDAADAFHNGLAFVELNGKFGYIDKKGNIMPNK